MLYALAVVAGLAASPTIAEDPFYLLPHHDTCTQLSQIREGMLRATSDRTVELLSYQKVLVYAINVTSAIGFDILPIKLQKLTNSLDQRIAEIFDLSVDINRVMDAFGTDFGCHDKQLKQSYQVASLRGHPE